MKPKLIALIAIIITGVTAWAADDPVVAHAVVEWQDIVRASNAAMKNGTIPARGQVVPLMRRPPGINRIPAATKQAAPAGTHTPEQPAASMFAPMPITLLTGFLAVPDGPDVYGYMRIPPDTMGAAGPSHLMTTLNPFVRIQDKTGATTSTVTLNDFWASVNGNTGDGNNGTFDPKIVYDQEAGRFIFVAIDNTDANNGILLGVSSNSNPTGAWYMWKIDGDGANVNWADFPSVGHNIRWIAVAANMFTIAANAYVEPKMWVFDKYKAYSNTLSIVATYTGTQLTAESFTVAPCVTFGSETNLYTVDSGWFDGASYYVRVGKISGLVSSPTWSLVSGGSFGGGYFTVPTYSTVGDAPQLGGADLIDNGDSRISSPPVFRHGRVYCCFTGGLSTPTRHGIIWAEIDPLGLVTPINSGAIQESTKPMFYAYPSIAVNSQTSIVVGFSGFSTGIYASAYFTGRQVSDAANSMQTVQLLKAGEDYYYKTFGGSRNRWGDYSYTCVDPSDDLVFWTIQEYARPAVGIGVNDDRWGTWWGKISFTPEPSLPLSAIALAILALRGRQRAAVRQ